MGEVTFTPGPWKCAERPVFGAWFVRQDPKDWNGMGYQLICELPSEKKGSHYGDMFSANAHLIAAAPELYAALEELLRASHPVFSRADGFHPAACEKAEAVLKKARGLPPSPIQGGG